jgi:hypothetical protein
MGIQLVMMILGAVLSQLISIEGTIGSSDVIGPCLMDEDAEEEVYNDGEDDDGMKSPQDWGIWTLLMRWMRICYGQKAIQL